MEPLGPFFEESVGLRGKIPRLVTQNRPVSQEKTSQENQITWLVVSIISQSSGSNSKSY
jgi:hypothetical protein